jgi:hypothetical protein
LPLALRERRKGESVADCVREGFRFGWSVARASATWGMM